MRTKNLCLTSRTTHSAARPFLRFFSQAFLDRYQIQVGGMLEDWAAGIKNLLIEKIVSLNLSLKDTMKLFDPDGSGFMDEEELMQVLAKIDIKPTLAQVHELTYDLEKNGKGEVDVHAFIESLQCKYEGDTADAHKGSEAMQKFGMMLHLKGDRLVTIFEKFDSSGDGKVDYDEFVGFAKELLVESGAKGSITDDELMEIARSLDSNGSGDIDFMEFVDAFAKPKEHGEKIMEHVCQSLMRYGQGSITMAVHRGWRGEYPPDPPPPPPDQSDHSGKKRNLPLGKFCRSIFGKLLGPITPPCPPPSNTSLGVAPQHVGSHAVRPKGHAPFFFLLLSGGGASGPPES